jgi:hypothetical protein
LADCNRRYSFSGCWLFPSVGRAAESSMDADYKAYSGDAAEGADHVSFV